jgi:hypothetical protein
MRTSLLTCLVLLFTLSSRAADAGALASPAVIRELLADFLTHNSDPKRHENFWADDLVYTSAMGIVRGKPEVMKSVRDAAARPTTNPPAAGGAAGAPTYIAEDINIRPFNGFAALTFRLVARMPDGTTDTYRNSGTFVFRDGRWQVITWQATKVPPAEKK